MADLAFRPSQLLPNQDPSKPIELHEIAALRRLAQRPPSEKDGWTLEVEENGVQVHRLAEVVDEDSGATVERIRCQCEMDCDPISALMFMKDPDRRSMWDDYLGPTMKVLRAQGHEFVNFQFEGMLGIASKSFLLWSRAQAYDSAGQEREGGDAATMWAMLWRPTNVGWPGLPTLDDSFEKNVHWGMIAERIADSYKCRLKIYVRCKYISTMMMRNVIPRLINYYSSDYCSRLQTVAASKAWRDTEKDIMGPYAQQVSPLSLPPANLTSSSSASGAAPAAGALVVGRGAATAEETWSPERGMSRPAGKPLMEDVEVLGSAVVHDDDQVPAYQLRYERARKRDMPALEPLQSRLKGVLTDWRTNLAQEAAHRVLPLARATPAFEDLAFEASRDRPGVAAEGSGFRGSDAWLGSIMGSMNDVKIVAPPWLKQEVIEPRSVEPIRGNVWSRLDKAGLGGRPISEAVDAGYPSSPAGALKGEATLAEATVEAEGEATWGGLFGGLFGAEGAEGEPAAPEQVTDEPNHTKRRTRKLKTAKRAGEGARNEETF